MIMSEFSQNRQILALSESFGFPTIIAGIPGISVPCGTTDFDGAKNLPVGLQILAPHLEEAKLLRIAKAAEG